jgi:hypothetical protein
LNNNNNNELNVSYSCLKQENNKNKYLFKQLSKKKSYLSLSDLCRIQMIDMNSYVCYGDLSSSVSLCYWTLCYNRTNNKCTGKSNALPGTPCGLNKHCQYGICMDITEPTRESNLIIKDHCIQGIDNEYLYDKNVLYEQTTVSDLKFFQECKSDLKTLKCEACLKQQYSYDYYRANKKTINTIFSFKCDHFNGTNPCLNGGSCITKLNTSSSTSFYCKCPHDFTGDLCLSPKHKPCDLNPCPINSECFEYGELGQYYCFLKSKNNGYQLIDETENNNNDSLKIFLNTFDYLDNNFKKFFQNIFHLIYKNNVGYKFNLKFSFYYLSCLWLVLLETGFF